MSNVDTMDVIENTRDKVYCITYLYGNYITVAAETYNNIVTFTSFTDKPTGGDSFEWNT